MAADRRGLVAARRGGLSRLRSIGGASLRWSAPVSPAGLVTASLLLAGLAWSYHHFLLWQMRSLPFRLGALDERFVVPLHARFEPQVSAWTPLAAATLVAWALAAPWLVRRRGLRAAALLAVSAASFAAIGLSVAMSDGERRTWTGDRVSAVVWPYTRTYNEYYGDVPRLEARGLGAFLANYSKPRVFSELSLHARTHPPGGVVFLWLVSRLFGPGLWAAALATVLFTSLAVIPVYLLARDLYGEAIARGALALFLLMPNVVLFTTTSMDGPFSVLPMASLFLFHRSAQRAGTRQSGAWGLASGLALGLATFLTYAAVFMGLYFTVFCLLGLAARRESPRMVLPRLVSIGAGFLAVYAFLYAAFRYDPIAAMLASMHRDEKMMGTGYESLAVYLHLSVANLAAFFVMSGLVTTVLWLAESQRALRAPSRGLPEPFLCAYAASLLIVAFSTLFTLEVERIWMFMAPFLVAPAAAALARSSDDVSSLRWATGLLALQVLLSEVLLRTDW